MENTLEKPDFCVAGADLRKELGLRRRDWEGLLLQLGADGEHFQRLPTGAVTFTREGAEKLRAFLRKTPPPASFPGAEGLDRLPVEKNAPTGSVAPPPWLPAMVIKCDYPNRRVVKARVEGGGECWVSISDQWHGLYKPGMQITVQFQRAPDWFRTKKPRAVGRQ